MDNTYLVHHGIKGQRWGVRRYQNPDGSLTAEGKARAGRQADRRKDATNIFRGISSFENLTRGVQVGYTAVSTAASTALAPVLLSNYTVAPLYMVNPVAALGASVAGASVGGLTNYAVSKGIQWLSGVAGDAMEKRESHYRELANS